MDHLFSSFFNNYAAYEYYLASTQLFMAMLGMGALLAVDDFFLEIKNPKGLGAGLATQWLLTPLIAVAIGKLLTVPDGIILGLMLAVAVPGGTLTNILTYFGRGNIALSVSLTAITTVAALLVTPLLLQLMMAAHLPKNFEMPVARIAQDIVVTLLFPLAIGMFLRVKTSPRAGEQFAKWVIRLSLLLIVLMAVGAGGSGRLDPHAYGIMGIVALVVLGLSLQLGSFLVTKIANLVARDSLAIVVEVTFRNMSLAVAIKAIIFPAIPGQLDPLGDAVLFTVLLYGGVSLFLSVAPVLLNRLKN